MKSIAPIVISLTALFSESMMATECSTILNESNIPVMFEVPETSKNIRLDPQQKVDVCSGSVSYDYESHQPGTQNKTDSIIPGKKYVFTYDQNTGKIELK